MIERANAIYRERLQSAPVIKQFVRNVEDDPKVEVSGPININEDYLDSKYVVNIKTKEKLNDLVTSFFSPQIQEIAPYTYQEWTDILQDQSKGIEDDKKLYSSIANGFPGELRREIWLYLARTHLLQRKNSHKGITYETLKDKLCSEEHKIKKDIGRSCSDHEFFQTNNLEKTESLQRVLRAYANFDPEVGYTQGMNLIVGMLLYFVQSEYDEEEGSGLSEKVEEEVFWILVYIMQEKEWRMTFINDTPKLQSMLDEFEKRIKESLPELYLLMTEHNCFPICFIQYFVTLLIYKSPSDLAKKILEAFLVVGEDIIYHVLLKILAICEKEILTNDSMESLYSYLKSQLFESVVMKL